MYVQLSSPLTRTTMRTPAALSAPRSRPFPRIWLPAPRVSVAPVKESVAVCESPLSAAWTLCPLDARSRVTSETASARDCPEGREGCTGGGGAPEGGTAGAEATCPCCCGAAGAEEMPPATDGRGQPVEVLP